jgi:hypothetical protein
MSNTYIAETFAGYVDVRAGRKPLLIVSYGKSSFAGTTLTNLAFEDEMQVHHEDFVCEDGKLHRHAFICLPGAPYAREARDAIVDCISSAVLTRSKGDRMALRERLQTTLGHLLGHSAAEIRDFVTSDIGRTCPCDCCGSEYTVTAGEVPDRHASPRFIPNAYAY